MEMPLFGIGTYTVTGEECSNIIFNGLKLGYRLIDTAVLYDNHNDAPYNDFRIYCGKVLSELFKTSMLLHIDYETFTD